MDDVLGVRHHHAEDIDRVHEAGHDGRFTRRLAGRHQTARVCTDARPSLLDWNLACAGHVDLTAIGVARHHAQLLLATQRQHALARLDADGHASDRSAEPNGVPAAIQSRTVA